MLDTYFKDKQKAGVRSLYIPYLSLGDPDLVVSEQLVDALVTGGADILELGIPFSDPIADGPVIQRAFSRALANEDVNFYSCLELTGRIHQKYPDLPIVYLIYFNLVYHYGLEKMLQKCAEIGVKGLVIPDLPFDAPEGRELLEKGQQYGVDLIHLVTPQTTPERQKAIGEQNTGFIYFVSSYGVTGARKELADELKGWVESVRANTGRPVAVGFGVSRPDQAESISHFADGVIVGSANHALIEDNLENPVQAVESLQQYTRSMADAAH